MGLGLRLLVGIDAGLSPSSNPCAIFSWHYSTATGHKEPGNRRGDLVPTLAKVRAYLTNSVTIVTTTTTTIIIIVIIVVVVTVILFVAQLSVNSTGGE